MRKDQLQNFFSRCVASLQTDNNKNKTANLSGADKATANLLGADRKGAFLPELSHAEEAAMLERIRKEQQK
jgi:hypothetical protein